MPRTLKATLFALAAAGALWMSPAAAQNVFDYAVSHPTDNAHLPQPPAPGDSVPQSVSLVKIEGNDSLAYFYYDGRPVIVDLKTRSVVRVGQ
ncbi:hypothetical protein [Aurantimonas sp. Leaf443]|uniref:hypothetical protein n=1 Tax=Aurantimonas sp. Leaf443 TaxID=1736378 RepID=UPI0006F52843|nr:hypothetical protein [Aurantimonas sp. Leaf443]KQT83949.1 hypothetical protein ASG48_11220 [Aurantimonas sp. Leaf443]